MGARSFSTWEITLGIGTGVRLELLDMQNVQCSSAGTTAQMLAMKPYETDG